MTRLRIQVVVLETGWVEDLVLADNDDTLLWLQFQRHVERGMPEAFSRWLSSVISVAIPDLVDYDLRMPSEAQLKFATAIARALGLPLAPEVLRYRGCMHDFLSAHKDAFTERHTGNRSKDDQVG
jgi:hypothetical protein